MRSVYLEVDEKIKHKKTWRIFGKIEYVPDNAQRANTVGR